MATNTSLKTAILGGLIGAATMCALGLQGGPSNVRLQSLFPGSTQSGHTNIDGTSGVNGVVLKDNARGNGFLEFPGEARIFNRTDLIGPAGTPGANGTNGLQGDQGIQGEQGVPGTPGPGRLIAWSHVFGGGFVEDGLLMQTSVTITEPAVIMVMANGSYIGLGPIGETAYFRLTYSNGVDEFPILTSNMWHDGNGPFGEPVAEVTNPTINYVNEFPAGTYTFKVYTEGDPTIFVNSQVPHIQVMAFAVP